MQGEEVIVYRVERWYNGETSPQDWPGDEYLNMPLSEATADLRSRGYELQMDGRREGKYPSANVLVIYKHPTTRVCCGLSAA